MTDSVPLPEDQPERRRASRTALRLSASVRKPGRGRVAARVIDISTHGCRIEATGGAAADSWVLLSIAGLETQYCRVAWGCQEFAGLEFATPLAEAVLESLLQGRHRSSETTVSELRDIANRTHRLAARHGDGETQSLSELSRRCAIDAVIEGLRLSEDESAAPTRK